MSESNVAINIESLLEEAKDYSRPIQSFEVDWVDVNGHVLPKIKIIYQ